MGRKGAWTVNRKEVSEISALSFIDRKSTDGRQKLEIMSTNIQFILMFASIIHT